MKKLSIKILYTLHLKVLAFQLFLDIQKIHLLTQIPLPNKDMYHLKKILPKIQGKDDLNLISKQFRHVHDLLICFLRFHIFLAILLLQLNLLFYFLQA